MRARASPLNPTHNHKGNSANRVNFQPKKGSNITSAVQMLRPPVVSQTCRLQATRPRSLLIWGARAIKYWSLVLAPAPTSSTMQTPRVSSSASTPMNRWRNTPGRQRKMQASHQSDLRSCKAYVASSVFLMIRPEQFPPN